MKRIIAGTIIGMFIGLALAGGMTAFEQAAGALPPNRIFQAPVYIQNGSTVLAAFYEDGGGNLPITGGASNADVAFLNVRRTLTADGGAVFRQISLPAGVGVAMGGVLATAQPMILHNIVTESDGGGLGHLIDNYSALPDCNCTSHKATAEAVSCVASSSDGGAVYDQITVSGAVNNNSVISYICAGPRQQT